MSYLHKSGSRDSSCLRETRFCGKLVAMRDSLYDQEIFIIGDSMYAIESFFISPYDLVNVKSPEDNFNFYH